MAKIIWLTGLSGAGKTTISKKLEKNFKKKRCLLIDGDIFRKKTKQTSFSKKNIVKNNLKIINYCKKNFKKFDYIIVSVISPLRKTRKIASLVFKQNYFELYVFANLKTLEKRDTKGLYALSKKGIVKNLIGFKSGIKYEKSLHKHLRLNTNKFTKKQCMIKVLKYVGD